MARGKAPARRPAPPAPAAKKAGKGRAPPVAVESSEDDASEDENFMSFDKQEEDSDVEKEAGVFDLKMKDSDDEDDSEEEDEESEEDSDDDEEDRYYEDDDDLNEEERDLQALVDNLPLEMRTKIRSGQAIDESEEEDEEEDPDDVARWGKKKAYYAGDTADLEIGQDMEDAIDEEEAAKELYQQKVKRMKKKDFYDDLDVAEDSNDDEAPKQKKKQTKDRVAKELEAIALGSSGDVGHGSDEVVLEKLAKDVSKMSKAQKLELIAENSPELLTIVSELRERVDELQSRITPVKALVQKLLTESEMPVDDDLVDYLEVKQQLLLSYCVNVTFYLYMKSLGKSVRNHPVMRQLLRLRYCMEKMQGLDGKLKYQIDRLAKVAESGEVSGELQASLLRPNLASLMEDDDEEANGAVSKKRSSKKSKHADSSEEEEDEEDEESEIEDDDDEDPRAARKAAASKDNIYRAPKLTSMPYPNEREEEKRDRKLEKHKQKLRTSELMAALTAEFGTAPEESASSGFGDNSGDLKRLEEEQKERIKFEEDHFIRTVSIIAKLILFFVLQTNGFVCLLFYIDHVTKGQERYQT